MQPRMLAGGRLLGREPTAQAGGGFVQLLVKRPLTCHIAFQSALGAEHVGDVPRQDHAQPCRLLRTRTPTKLGTLFERLHESLLYNVGWVSTRVWTGTEL